MAVKSIVALALAISSCDAFSSIIHVPTSQPVLHSVKLPSRLFSSSDIDMSQISIQHKAESPKNTGTRISASQAAMWHKNRRKKILAKYSSQILPLEQQSHGLFVGLPLLILSNISLSLMAIRSAALTVPQIVLLALPGSMFSLWQLQILHDSLHSSLLPKPSYQNPSKLMQRIIKHRRKIQKSVLLFGSMPSAFGYYLYLQYGHLTHHNALGDPDKVSLATLFNSTQKNFEDGDVLFTAHRMKLLGDIGPTFKFRDREITMSISKSGFSLWKEGHPFRNALAFTSSFLFERSMLIINDFVVAAAGRNFFFPNKPLEFHKEAATYCRIAVFVRLLLCCLAKSWKPLLFLYLVETIWSIPPHPACAMFITNHGSKEDGENRCIPSSSTYAGKWYALMTLGTNYHVEHHDFPTIPLHELWKLRKIAPEFYRGDEKDDLFAIMKKTFAKPEFYSCMNANVVID
jgi:hypothetical protein